MAVRFNRDGRYLLTCGKDRTFRLWNPYKATLIKTYGGHAHEVRDVAAAADNSRRVPEPPRGVRVARRIGAASRTESRKVSRAPQIWAPDLPLPTFLSQGRDVRRRQAGVLVGRHHGSEDPSLPRPRFGGQRRPLRRRRFAVRERRLRSRRARLRRSIQRLRPDPDHLRVPRRRHVTRRVRHPHRRRKRRRHRSNLRRSRRTRARRRRRTPGGLRGDIRRRRVRPRRSPWLARRSVGRGGRRHPRGVPRRTRGGDDARGRAIDERRRAGRRGERGRKSVFLRVGRAG